MEVIDVNIKLYIYTSYWYNCVTEPIWTECVDCGEVRYIFPLGNIYIYIYIAFGDQLATLIPGVDANRPSGPR